MTLNKSRQYAIGMSSAVPLGLQYSEIAAYARYNGFDDPEEFPVFVEMVYVLDDVYLTHARKEKK